MLLYVVLQISLLIGIGFVLWMIWDAWQRRHWRFVIMGIILTFLAVWNILGLFFNISGR